MAGILHYHTNASTNSIQNPCNIHPTQNTYPQMRHETHITPRKHGIHTPPNTHRTQAPIKTHEHHTQPIKDIERKEQIRMPDHSYCGIYASSSYKCYYLVN